MPPLEPVTITSERLVLRRLRDDDVGALFAIFGNAEVMRFWGSSPLASPAEADALLRRIEEGYQSGDTLQLGVVRATDALLIGTCTLHQFNWPSRRAELGYALGRPFWGQGYMHEALLALLPYAFGTLDLNRLEADIDPRNSASAKVLERVGFRREGLLRERWIVGDEVSDTAFYGLLRREWHERQ